MILLYYKVAPETPSIWWVSADTFDKQMADLQAYEVVALDAYDATNPRHVVITFDGVYENVWKFALPILRKWGYPFELFVIGTHIGGNNAFDDSEPPAAFASVEQLQEMVLAGGRVQWHSMTHQRLDALPKPAVDEELAVPSWLSEKFPAPHFRWFAYPHGDHQPVVVESVRTRFHGALSCIGGNDSDRHQLNRVTVFEDTPLGTSSVAVIVANYNYGRFVAEAIESVLAQTRAPDEILVIDDASSDGSEEVISRYADRIRFVRNDQNLGIVANFNKAVSLTRSRYIAILGADNRMRGDYVERCKALLDASPQIGVVYTDMLVFGPRARLLATSVGAVQVGESMLERWPIYLWKFPEPTAEVLSRFDSVNFVHGSSMYRREAYDRVGGYRDSSGPEDHHLFRRILGAGWGLVRSPQPLIEYRQHSAAQANTALSLQLENERLRDAAVELREEISRLQHAEGELRREIELSRVRLDAAAAASEAVETAASARCRTLEESLRLAESERTYALDALAAIRRSTSWWITAPMRFAVHLLRGDTLWVSSALRQAGATCMRRIPAGRASFLRKHYGRLSAHVNMMSQSAANASAIDDIVAQRCASTRLPIVVDPLSGRATGELPAIDIGVVTFNSGQWVTGFVASLVRLEYPRERLYVRFVDNASTDDTVDRLEAAVAELRAAGFESELLRRPNQGYGAGHNAAIRAGDAPFCLVSNIDLEFEPDALLRVAAIAAVDSSRVAAWELRQKPLEHPKFYDPVTGLTNWNSHACVLLRRSAYERVGGYDAALFMYAEDVELSYRLRRAGYQLRYCPAAVVWHFCYEFALQVKPVQYVGSTFGSLYLRLKYGTVVDMAAVLPLSLRLLLAPEPFPGSRRRVAKSLLKLVALAPRALGSRRRSSAHFPFRLWDFEMVRDGAFIEVSRLPAEAPLVSVITRTYGGRAAFLREAMLSVAHQTYPNIEHIIVEDGGDSQADVVREVSAITGRPSRYLPLEKAGRSATGNAGLAAATGRWLLFLDDDDLLFADHVEVLVAALLADSGAAAAYTPAWEVVTEFASSTEGGYRELTHRVPDALLQPFDADVLAHHNIMAIQSVLFERRVYEERGGFDEDMDALEDWVLWNRYAAGRRFVYVPKVTSIFRTPADKTLAGVRAVAFERIYPLAAARASAYRRRHVSGEPITVADPSEVSGAIMTRQG